MIRKIKVLITPLLIERLKAFVAAPTMKTWAPVSRLVNSRDMKYAVSYRNRDCMPIIQCSRMAGGNCDGCVLLGTETSYPHRCSAQALGHQDKLSDRLMLAIKVIAAAEESGQVAVLDSPSLAIYLEQHEEAQLRRKEEAKERGTR